MRKDRVIRSYGIKENGEYLRKHNGDLTYEGMYHHKLMIRSKNDKYKEYRPTYKDVTVSENFTNFQFFAEWCNKQIGFGQQGFVLDKDLLIPQNKIYSENSCVFVPDVINSFLTFVRQKDRGLPVGVTWCESEGKYKSYCSQLNGKNKTLGRFNNPSDAYIAYCGFKEAMARKLAETYKDQVDSRVTESLLSFKVEKYIKEEK